MVKYWKPSVRSGTRKEYPPSPLNTMSIERKIIDKKCTFTMYMPENH